jgi:ribosomal protein S18 acetylase RimI-like enzyme
VVGPVGRSNVADLELVGALIRQERPVSVLDNPAWWALTGPQRSMGTATSLAARFDPAVSPFGALGGTPTEDHWHQLAALTGPGGTVALVRPLEDALRPGPGWSVPWQADGVQMIGDQIADGLGAWASSRPTLERRPDPLGQRDVDDMLALVAETRPGPFLARTIEFGGYLGIRREGRLVAMAGERMRPPGHAEVSAVATDPAFRRQGLGEGLVWAVIAGIVDRGEIPFLHAAGSNVNAIRLYRSMGFTVRRSVVFMVMEAPRTVPG